MILEQLKKIKKTSSFSKKYSNSEDLDLESLLDLIPDCIKNTKYLSSSSLHFDRFRLTTIEELKFNKKFKNWLMSLVIYGHKEEFGFLLDFLIRKYHVYKYNQKEFIFITLPYPKYYTNILSKFDFLRSQNSFSTQFYAECCAKYIDFFYMVVDYFDFYEHLKDFLNELIEHFLIKNLNFVHKYEGPLNDIIEKINNDENQLVVKIKSALEGKLTFSKKLITDVDVLMTIDTNTTCFKQNSSRELLKNLQKLEDYFCWLKTNKLEDINFTRAEYEILHFIFFNNEDFFLEDDFSFYKDLAEKIEPKERLYKILYPKFKEEIKNISRQIYNFFDKETMMCILNEFNYKDLHIKDKDILIICLNFITFEPNVFCEVILSIQELEELCKQNYNKIFMTNLKYYCEFHNLYVDYLFKEQNVYKSLAEFAIEDCIDIDLILFHFNKDNNIIERINNFSVLKELCDKLGYESVLKNRNLEFILKFCKFFNFNLNFCSYMLNRFEVEDIIPVLKDNAQFLIHFLDKPYYKKLKIIINEFCATESKCKYIINTILNDIKLIQNDLDLIYLYKPEYEFINNFKDQILDSCFSNLDIMDYLISFTDYDDIRIINKVSLDFIKQQKKSILVLFKKYGNVMIPFIDDFIKLFDYTSFKKDLSLINISHNILIKSICKHNKMTDYDYLLVYLLKTYKDINIELFPGPENLSHNLIYNIIKYKFVNEINFDCTNLLEYIYLNNLILFMKLTKFFTIDYKNIYFNKLLYAKKYEMINKHFVHFNLDSEDILYTFLSDYFSGEDIANEFSIVSNNSKDIKKLTKSILFFLDSSTIRALTLISKCLDNHKNYESCHKDIYESILLFLDSRDEEIRSLSRLIYDKLIIK